MISERRHNSANSLLANAFSLSRHQPCRCTELGDEILPKEQPQQSVHSWGRPGCTWWNGPSPPADVVAPWTRRFWLPPVPLVGNWCGFVPRGPPQFGVPEVIMLGVAAVLSAPSTLRDMFFDIFTNLGPPEMVLQEGLRPGDSLMACIFVTTVEGCEPCILRDYELVDLFWIRLN